MASRSAKSDPERPCAKCGTAFAEPRRRHCLACIRKREEEDLAQEERRRQCKICGNSYVFDDFRSFNRLYRKVNNQGTHKMLRSVCYRCYWETEPEALSPYQRAIMECEALSGVKHEVWMNHGDSMWNRLHYERMAELAGVPVDPNFVETHKLYFMEVEEPMPGVTESATLPVPKVA